MRGEVRTPMMRSTFRSTSVFPLSALTSEMCEMQVIMEGLIIIAGALSCKALAFNNQSKIVNHQSAIRWAIQNIDFASSNRQYAAVTRCVWGFGFFRARDWCIVCFR